MNELINTLMKQLGNEALRRGADKIGGRVTGRIEQGGINTGKKINTGIDKLVDNIFKKK